MADCEKHCVTIFAAPDDFTSISGTFIITDTSSVQCVNISVEDDSEDEAELECFVFAISGSVTEGVLLSPTEATICIKDNDGRGHSNLSVC